MFLSSVPTKLSNGLDQITNALGQLTCRTTGIKVCIGHFTVPAETHDNHVGLY